MPLVLNVTNRQFVAQISFENTLHIICFGVDRYVNLCYGHVFHVQWNKYKFESQQLRMRIAVQNIYVS